MITDLFYSHILDMDRSSHHTRSLDVYASPVLDTDDLKMALRARKVSGTFKNRETGPRARLLGSRLTLTQDQKLTEVFIFLV